LGARLGSDGLLIGIDQDPDALSVASKRLTEAFPNQRIKTLAGNFSNLDNILMDTSTMDTSIPGIDAFVFDLGTSSHQIDTLERGFSYAREAPLDMRMNPSQQTLTAAEVINTKNEADLAWILTCYGEERWAARIAKAIVKKRSQTHYKTTTELVSTINEAIPAAARRTGGNPAKRSFQALRIFVNDELGALTKGLEAALRWLNPNGRIAVISFHSLEDRIVKQVFNAAQQGCICPPEAAICVWGKKPRFETLTKKPLTPTESEVINNPRSASAKLRAIRKRADL
jgi:16S rRNA (cytosine1402-N4)-methyltransferase